MVDAFKRVGVVGLRGGEVVCSSAQFESEFVWAEWKDLESMSLDFTLSAHFTSMLSSVWLRTGFAR